MMMITLTMLALCKKNILQLIMFAKDVDLKMFMAEDTFINEALMVVRRLCITQDIRVCEI